MDARTHEVCVLCGACDATAVMRDCGHVACEACCDVLPDAQMPLTASVCYDCLIEQTDGPIAWG